MTRPTDPLFDQRIADWLDDDPRRAPGSVLGTVLTAIPTIPQRRASRVPWGFTGPVFTRSSVTAAAAIVVLAVGGAFILGHRGQPAVVGGPSPTPATSVSPTADARPTPDASPAPSEASATAQPTPGMFAYITAAGRAGQLWVANVDGTGARRLAQDLGGSLGAPSWSPDGTRLVFSQTDMDWMGFPSGHSRLYLTDATGSQPQLVDTGCVAPCHGDSDAAFSSDGKRLVFVRTGAGSVLATVDLTTGHVAELASTRVSETTGNFQSYTPADHHPRWSPDGTRIVFTQDVPNHASGKASTWGPLPAVFVVDADGRNFHQVGPAALTADWSPDGARIVFGSVSLVDIRWRNLDIYTIRPDGSDLRRLTSDEFSFDPSWTADGRIGFIRAPIELTPDGYVKPPGPWQFWVMDADGGNATQLSVSPQPSIDEAAGWPISWPPQP